MKRNGDSLAIARSAGGVCSFSYLNRTWVGKAVVRDTIAKADEPKPNQEGEK